MELNGKRVVISGASSGIGEAAARRFAARGAKVMLLARREEALRRIAGEIAAAGGEAEWWVLDVGDAAAVSAACGAILDGWGAPDVLINNAGSGCWRFVEETEAAEAEEMFRSTVLGALHLTKGMLPSMRERGGGCIVNLTSFAAILPFSGATAYIASRKAMVGFHEALSADLEGSGVSTSLAYFAKVDSSFWAHNPGSEERLPGAQRMIPVIDAERAARAIVDGVERGRRRISAPGMVRVIEFMSWLNPWIARWVMSWTGYGRRLG